MRALAREAAQTILLAAAVFLALQTVVQTYRVEQRSMTPTLQEGQYLVVTKLAYLDVAGLRAILLPRRASAAEPEPAPGALIGSPQRGDIVVFDSPSHNGQHLIKRVIGLPGDRIEARGGRVYVNGQALDEPYLPAPVGYSLEPRVVPAGDFFVLGDNRNNSYDSHVFGPIPGGLIVGKALPLPYVALPSPTELPALLHGHA